MNVLNVGSLNIDKTYEVDHLVRPGETLLSNSYETFMGGKGLNQSIALAKAGAKVWHAGCIGEDGVVLKQYLDLYRVDTSLISVGKHPTGHAVIQIDKQGNNTIIVDGGSNQRITKEDIDAMFAGLVGDFLVLVQNETSHVDYVMEKANECGFQIAFNPSPITKDIRHYPLHLVDYLIFNEVEGYELTGHQEVSAMLDVLSSRYPKAKLVLTLGAEGVIYRYRGKQLSQPSFDVKVVDTTAAGDTFCGYFLAEIIKGTSIADALRVACLASSYTVSTKGASKSIPLGVKVEKAIKRMME